MAFLVAAVVLVGVVGLLNLVFTFGVIRRLREHTEILDRLSSATTNSSVLEPGQSVATFSATTVDGRRVSSSWPEGLTLVGFFTPTCEPCRAKMPAFIEQAGRHPGGRDLVLAVVVSDSDDVAAPVVADLGEVARVIRDAEGGKLSTAFGVSGFPAFMLVGPGGRVSASGSDVAAVAGTPSAASTRT